MSSFDEFVNDLPNSEEEFDIKGEIPGSQPKEDEQVVEEKSPVIDEEKIPYNENPKIKKFIERQVQKQLRNMQVPQQEVAPKRDNVQTNGDVPYEFIALYGDTEETRKAWVYQEKLLNNYAEKGKQEALKEWEQRQTQLTKNQAQEDENVDDILEEVGTYLGIDFDSDKEAQKTYLTILERLSPKDSDGNITEYADPIAVADIFKSRTTKRDNSQKKVLANRTIAPSTEAPTEQKGYERGQGFDAVRNQLGIQ